MATARITADAVWTGTRNSDPRAPLEGGSLHHAASRVIAAPPEVTAGPEDGLLSQSRPRCARGCPPRLRRPASSDRSPCRRQRGCPRRRQPGLRGSADRRATSDRRSRGSSLAADRPRGCGRAAAPVYPARPRRRVSSRCLPGPVEDLHALLVRQGQHLLVPIGVAIGGLEAHIVAERRPQPAHLLRATAVLAVE